MARFTIYNYNFLRIIEPNEQMQIEFPEWERVDVEESFSRRQELLDELLEADYGNALQFVNKKGKDYWHKQITKPQDGVYVMRVANVTNVTITDENLKRKEYADYRNCLVVIDNRKGIQRIAIEKKSKAFSDTKTVANILEATLCKLFRQKLLKVQLTAVYGSHVFWDTVDRYPQGFVKASFIFPHLNIERLTKVMDNYLKKAREEWGSNLELTFRANDGGTLKIDKGNAYQKALVDGASGSGALVKLYPKGEKNRAVYCGKGHYYEIEIDAKLFDGLVSDALVLPEVGCSPMDRIKIVMKDIPDVVE